MSVLAVIVTFFLTWWTIIFLVVPPSNDRKEKGAAYPDNPRFTQKILLTSLFSALITLAIWGSVRLDIFSFRQWAAHWDENRDEVQEKGMTDE